MEKARIVKMKDTEGKKIARVIELTLDEADNLTAAVGKLTALAHFMNDAHCSGNEIEDGDAIWLFIYMFEELGKLKKAVDSMEPVAALEGHRVK